MPSFAPLFFLNVCWFLHQGTALHNPTSSSKYSLLDLSHGHSAQKTYLFSNHYWWESSDHQMTTIVTLLAIAKNLSAIPVLPAVPIPNTQKPVNKSLVGDYFDLSDVSQVQPVLTLKQFLDSSDYRVLRREKTGTVPFPKDSQEEYEARLHLYGRLTRSIIPLAMPAVDPEHTNHYCHQIPGTIHVSADGTRRFIFLERIHFMHFCAEKFLPWWYDIRHRISPLKPYANVADQFLVGKPSPVVAIHVNDVMESDQKRENEEVERYAREIVDSLRKYQSIDGTLYFIYDKKGRNVQKVVNLLQQEFHSVYNCTAIFSCAEQVPSHMFEPPLEKEQFEDLFKDRVGQRMVEWALGTRADLFIGNIHSPYSRNICLHRKTHGRAYSALRGFGELRKIWSWNL